MVKYCWKEEKHICYLLYDYRRSQLHNLCLCLSSYDMIANQYENSWNLAIQKALRKKWQIGWLILVF